MHLRAAPCLLISCLLACTTREDTSLSPGERNVGGESPDLSFTWRKAGGETTDFGGNDPPGCTEESTPIERAQAVARGFDVDAELAQLEGVVSADLVWSEQGCYDKGTCPHTILTQTTRLESLVFHSRGVAEGAGASEGDCVDDLSYLLRVELATADGSLSTSVLADVRSRQGHVAADSLVAFGGERIGVVGDSWIGAASAQLSDLHGSEHVLFAAKRPHWNAVAMSVQLGALVEGSMDATILYTDGAQPAEHAAMRRATWSNAGAATAYGDPLPKGVDSVALDDYQGSLVPPTFDVRAAPRFDQAGAQLSVSVNGELRQFDTIPAEQVLDIGKLRIGDVVSASVTNPSGGWVGSTLQIGDCTYVSVGCTEPGCAARAEATVAPHHCPAPGDYYD